MEKGEQSLDESLAAYERGIALYRECQKALEQAEQRVRLLADPAICEGGIGSKMPADPLVPGLGVDGWKPRWRPGLAPQSHTLATTRCGDALLRARRRQARAAPARLREGRACVASGHALDTVARVGRTHPRLLARARRPARHGRRRSAPRQADHAQRIRRSHGHPRGRRPASAGRSRSPGKRTARPRASASPLVGRTSRGPAAPCGMCAGQGRWTWLPTGQKLWILPDLEHSAFAADRRADPRSSADGCAQRSCSGGFTEVVGPIRRRPWARLPDS